MSVSTFDGRTAELWNAQWWLKLSLGGCLDHGQEQGEHWWALHLRPSKCPMPSFCHGLQMLKLCRTQWESGTLGGRLKRRVFAWTVICRKLFPVPNASYKWQLFGSLCSMLTARTSTSVSTVLMTKERWPCVDACCTCNSILVSASSWQQGVILVHSVATISTFKKGLSRIKERMLLLLAVRKVMLTILFL